MAKGRKAALILALVLVVALYALFLGVTRQPRTFDQIMGRDYDPAQLTEVIVTLDPAERQEEIRFPLTPADPAFAQLMARLEQARYVPRWGENWGGRTTLDYAVNLHFCQGEEGLSAMAFAGPPNIGVLDQDISYRAYRPIDSHVFQEELLALLLDASPA